MKSLVVYYSETGNTEKVARAIAKGLNSELKRIDEATMDDIRDSDLICIGTPVHGSAPAEKVKKFLDEFPIMFEKKGAAFCTLHLFGAKRTFKIIKEKFKNKGISFIDGFSCRGLSRLVGNFGPRIFNKNRPNEEDLKKAENFGRKILEIAEKQ